MCHSAVMRCFLFKSSVKEEEDCGTGSKTTGPTFCSHWDYTKREPSQLTTRIRSPTIHPLLQAGWQQTDDSNPDIPLPANALQLLVEHPREFLGQITHIRHSGPRRCSLNHLGPPTWPMCPDHFQPTERCSRLPDPVTCVDAATQRASSPHPDLFGTVDTSTRLRRPGNYPGVRLERKTQVAGL